MDNYEELLGRVFEVFFLGGGRVSPPHISLFSVNNFQMKNLYIDETEHKIKVLGGKK